MDKAEIVKQLKLDEGYARVAKWDVKQFSFGYGGKAPCLGATISEPEAAKFLEAKVDECIDDFLRIFSGHVNKFNDTRANAFVNLIYNMGPGKKGHPENGGLQSFTNTLSLIFGNDVVPWAKVAQNFKLSKWYGQVGDRAVRIVNEVKTGVKAS